MPSNAEETSKAEETHNETVVPPLTKRQRQDAKDRTSVSVIVVHEAIRFDGEEELHRPMSALAWSGLAAGLSMGFSFVGEGLIRACLPDAPWRPLLTNLGYPLGFLIVVIGRQQLFTENTLTAIIPLLAERNLRTLAAVARLWAVVLAANLLGAHIFAWAAADTTFLRVDVQRALTELAREAAAVTFGSAIVRGIFAGWLIAMMVWMNAASNASRIPIIITLTYVVGLAGLTHIVAGSVEILYLVVLGERSWWAFLSGYMLPTLIGNSIGGVALVSALNHAQVVSGFEKGESPSRKTTPSA
jgi:formate/nitrite transporter FocA (FNT family)